MEKEIFKDVKGYAGYYRVSNFGNIVKPGGSCSPFAFAFVKPTLKDGKGNPKVILFKNDGGKILNVNEIVAAAFVPNPNNYSKVRNINGNPEDNTAKNLEWIE